MTFLRRPAAGRPKSRAARPARHLLAVAALAGAALTGWSANAQTNLTTANYGKDNGVAQLDGAAALSVNAAAATTAATERTLAQHFNDRVSAADYGMLCNFRTLNDVTATKGSPVITSPSAMFSASDVGDNAVGSKPNPYFFFALTNATIVYVNTTTSTQPYTNSTYGYSNISVPAGGAVLSQTMNQSVSSGGLLDVYADDTTAFTNAIAAAVGHGSLAGAELDLPAGVCAVRGPFAVADAYGVRITGEGAGVTSLLLLNSSDGLDVTETNAAPATIDDFSILKRSGANGSTLWSGVGLYVGNSNGRTNTGKTVIADMDVTGYLNTDGWNRGVELDSLLDMGMMNVRVTQPGSNATLSDIPAPLTSASGTPGSYGSSVAEGVATSFYVHGDNNTYFTDSTLLNLASTGGVTALGWWGAQGLHLLDEHFIASSLGVVEYPSSLIDEDFTLVSSLVEANNRDLILSGSDNNQVVSDLFWPENGATGSWIGIYAYGVFQNTAFNDNGILGNSSNSSSVGFDDCMNGDYPHTFDGNNLVYIPTAGVAVCSGTSGLTAEGNDFGGTPTSFSPFPTGPNFEILGNLDGTIPAIAETPTGGVSIGGNTTNGGPSSQVATSGGWAGGTDVVDGYVTNGSTAILTPAGNFPSQGTTTASAAASAGATTLTVANGALWTGTGGNMMLSDRASKSTTTAVVASVSGNTLTLAGAGLSGAVASGDTIASYEIPSAQIGTGLTLDDAVVHVEDLYCYGGNGSATRFDVDLWQDFETYKPYEAGSLVRLSSTTSSGAPALPSGVTFAISRGGIASEPILTMTNGSGTSLFCRGQARTGTGP